MRFALLGTLTLADRAGSPIAVPGPRQRALLAALLLSANRPVPTDALAEVVWNGSPPPGAATTLRSHIRRLRGTLGSQTDTPISACDPGYQISVREPDLDVLIFERACREAGAARRAARWPEVSAAARRALELWRGTPLMDVPSQVLRDQFLPGLEQRYLQALEDRIEADLRLGSHDRLIPELRDLAAEHPMRERFGAQLIEALARAGRRAEALDTYRQVRRTLVTELGIEPGPQLQQLHQQILDSDVVLAASGGPGDSEQATAAPASSAGAPAGPPRQLPGAVPHFTGRSAELARLSQILAETSAQAPGTVVISAIGGSAGVGKTALAVHWAHSVAHRFAGGQLYVNLSGFDPSRPPVTPGEAIGGFLYALGVPADRIPADLATRAGLYRSMLADRQMLILLDNARDEQQVRELLPGSPACLVLVTSRNQLTGLAATENASLLELDVLSPAEARQMLIDRLGRQRTAAEPEAVTGITRLCGRLPIALAIAAARAAARPTLPLTVLAAELRDAQQRLDVLDAGDPAANVRAVFSWSYRQLHPVTARIFRLLGLHPGPEVSIPAMASLGGLAPAHAESTLRLLVRAHLLTEHVPGRYSLHDLLRAYAGEQARSTDSAAERSASIGRVLDHYLHTAHAAALVLHPNHEPITLTPLRPGVIPEHSENWAPVRITPYQQAMTWFEAEHDVLLACVTLAANTGFDTHAWQLPWAMASFLDRRGHWHEWMAISRLAVAAATRCGATSGQIVSRRLHAIACIRLAEYKEADGQLTAGLELAQLLGDRVGEARVRHTICWLADVQGRYADALGEAERALALFEAIGDRPGYAEGLNTVGWLLARLGDYRRANAFCERALAVYREVGEAYHQAHAWDSLGYTEHHLGHYARAADCYHQALRGLTDFGDEYYRARVLNHLGDAYQADGARDSAREAWKEALRIFEELQRPDADVVRAKLE
ncbi:MAG TPA: BTAD domain-containing putative transcriptional regulator [Streptosporangiaceae bacterium]|nr:BTAD domain-containing putative transcriptional regulator [Streptosporangiaceae bacterium]